MPTKQPVVIEIERKTFPFEVKSIDESLGIIKGYLSVFNNVDSQKDRVRPSAFKKTIADALQRKDSKGKKYLYPVLWMHSPDVPIGGVVDAVEDKIGLLITAQLDITTNDNGIPLNPQATTVFSGLKMGYIDELSIGYKAIQKSYEAGTGIRDLTEIQLYEASVITMLFASNSDAQIDDVKMRTTALDTKAGSFPLADKATPWSKSKAIKDIEAATNNDWSKASKYFFWSAPNPTTEADHKFPFVANVGGTMKAVPRAIFNAAARLSGAKGVDIASVQRAMEPYYSKLKMTPPWKNGDKSLSTNELQYKDFNDRYREEQIRDWKSTDFQNLVIALQSAIMDIFAIGDEPQLDVLDTILNGVSDGGEAGNKIGFIDALKDYVQKGIDLDVSNYIDSNSYFGNVSSYGYMSRQDALEGKAGAVVSQSNAGRLKGHVDTLMEIKGKIDTVADDITHYITGGQEAYNNDDSKQTKPNQEPSKAHEPRTALKQNDQPPPSTDEFLDMLSSFLATQVPTNS